MSTFVFQLNILENNGGVPGAPIADGIVQIGDTFFLEILMGDVPVNPADAVGLTSSAVNINFNPLIVQNIDPAFEQDPIPLDSEVVTTNFSLFRSGNLDNGEGTITNLGGGSIPNAGLGSEIGVGQLDLFSQTLYEVTRAGSFDFQVTVDASQTSFADGKNLEPVGPMTIGVTAVPEPLTILGAATAAAIGTCFKRHLKKSSKR